MKLFKNLFSKNEEKDYVVQMYYGTKIKWSRISELLTKKDAERRSFYYSRIHPKNLFRSEFQV
tara:strand:+ start:266 stop:454 length:189 start_codon:yes stop_codon:yes gene_type:complete